MRISPAYVELQTQDGLQPVPVTNIYAIGRNYVAHAKELGNAVPTEPVVFMKPTAALVHEPMEIHKPSSCHELHFEAELVLLIGKIPEKLHESNAQDALMGYGLGLDLTDRDKQTYLKESSLPWTLAKGFKGSAPVSQFISAITVTDINSLSYTLTINDVLRQQADLALMLFSIPTLLCYLHEHIGLQTGDLIFTGTPSGVGPLHPGDNLVLKLDHYPLQATFKVAGQ